MAGRVRNQDLDDSAEDAAVSQSEKSQAEKLRAVRKQLEDRIEEKKLRDWISDVYDDEDSKR